MGKPCDFGALRSDMARLVDFAGYEMHSHATMPCKVLKRSRSQFEALCANNSLDSQTCFGESHYAVNHKDGVVKRKDAIASEDDNYLVSTLRSRGKFRYWVELIKEARKVPRLIALSRMCPQTIWHQNAVDPTRPVPTRPDPTRPDRPGPARPGRPDSMAWA